MINRLLPVVLILIAIGVFFGYVNPTYSGSVKALQAEITSYDAALAAARNFNEKRIAVADVQKNLPEGSIERIRAFLPDGVDNVQLILDLNALATRTGIELSDFDVNSSASVENDGVGALESDLPYDSLELTLTAVGTYDAFKRFLTGMEWSLRPMDLVELSIDDSVTGVYTYTMTFRIYWLR